MRPLLRSATDITYEGAVMIVVNRFSVPEDRAEEFVVEAEAAIEVLSAADGFLSADLGRNTDESTLWVLATRWRNVGSYRRALGSYRAKATAVPVLSTAIDEPSAYEHPRNSELGFFG
jgi:quinol monooxygenase YgiN